MTDLPPRIADPDASVHADDRRDIAMARIRTNYSQKRKQEETPPSEYYALRSTEQILNARWQADVATARRLLIRRRTERARYRATRVLKSRHPDEAAQAYRDALAQLPPERKTRVQKAHVDAGRALARRYRDEYRSIYDQEMGVIVATESELPKDPFPQEVSCSRHPPAPT